MSPSSSRVVRVSPSSLAPVPRLEAGVMASSSGEGEDSVSEARARHLAQLRAGL